MKRMQLTGIALLLMTGIPVISMAQDKVEADIGADLVSGYIWRGQDLGNVSIQPSASVSYKGFSLSGWGSVGLDKEDTKEFDTVQEDSAYLSLIIGLTAVLSIFTMVPTTLHMCSKRKSVTISVP